MAREIDPKDKAERVARWRDAVWAVYVASLVLDKAGEDLADSDILGAGLSREDRSLLATWLERVDAWAQTDTRRVTLPGLLYGTNLLEFEQLEELRAESMGVIMAEVDRILGYGDPCPPKI